MKKKIKFSDEAICNKKLPNLMRLMIIYLFITVFLFFLGPINYVIRNQSLVLCYLVIYPVALWCGYKAAEKKILCNPNIFPCNLQVKKADLVLINRILWLGIIFAIFSIFRVAQTTNIGYIVNNVIEGLLSPATRYASSNEAANVGIYGSSIMSLLLTLGLPACIAGIVLSVYYYKELTFGSKCLAITLILLHLISKLIVSANEGIFDLAIYIGVAVLLRYLSNVRGYNENKKTRKYSFGKKLLLFLGLILLVSMVLYYFTQNIIGRTQANFAFGTLGENKYNPDAPINKFIPEWLYVTFVYLTVYLCEGYYGFSLTTTIDWVPNFGVGFSSFIRNNVSDIIGVDLFQYSYQVRIQEHYNWGALKNYHSAYTFWANDVSRIGVILIMFIMGYAFCKCYYKSIWLHSKANIVLMPLMITMVLYLPANNKIFVQPASFLLVFYICAYNLFKYLAKRRSIYK